MQPISHQSIYQLTHDTYSVLDIIFRFFLELLARVILKPWADAPPHLLFVASLNTFCSRLYGKWAALYFLVPVMQSVWPTTPTPTWTHLCHSLPLSLSRYISLSFYLSFSIYLSMYLWLSLSLCFSLCVCVKQGHFVCVWPRVRWARQPGGRFPGGLGFRAVRSWRFQGDLS